MSYVQSDRPLLITILGVIYAIMAFVMIVGGIGIAVNGGEIINEMIEKNSSLNVLKGMEAVVGAVAVIMGIIYGVIALGFFKGWSIMWYLGVVFTIIGIIANIATAIIVAIIEVILLIYLFRPNVKQYFLGKV